MDGGRDVMGGERREAVGDVRVCLEAGFGPVAGVDQIEGFAAAGRLVFGIFAALAEFERELIRERTLAGLVAARAADGSRCRKPTYG